MVRSSCRPQRRLRRLAALASPALLAGLPLSLSAQNAPPAVTVAPVVVRDVAPVQSFIGHVTAIQAVQVVARVTAFVDDVPVLQGSDVKAGEVIYQLQKSQYQAAVDSAQAQVASAQAAQQLAQLTFQREQRLAQQNVEAQANLDQARATLAQNQANVQNAQANLDQARLNLSYCTIKSPIDGRIGAIALTKGNLVTPSTPPLATINQLDPIRVIFSVSDQVLAGGEQDAGSSVPKIAPGLAVTLQLPNGSPYQQTGRVSFLSNQVDPQTGTVSIYADFPNPNATLLPGGYVNVKVRPAKPEPRPLVPIQAVQIEQAGSFVLVVGSDNKVSQQSVKVGRQIGESYIVESGLSGGERVITQGVQKVHPGEVVTAQAEQPSQNPNDSGANGGSSTGPPTGAAGHGAQQGG